MNHTYDEFERAAKGYGMYHQFSQSDLNLARSNPNAGMSILNYKRDYQNAPTAEARALANAGADKIRREYGNYSGGTDGSKYYLQQNRPMSYQSPAAPTYQNRYDDRIQNLLREIENRPAFSYNAETDDLYGQYKKQYQREGQRATADALGQAAASGGMPSSYAVTAATQAGDYYASKMTDKIPELYQAAYNRYLNEYRQKAEALNMYQNAEQSDYNKYLTALNQHNADRNFNYGKYLDDISHQKERERWERQKALQAAAMGDYRAANEQGINTDNHPAEWEKKFQLAKMAASIGDLKPMRDYFNFDTSRADEFLMPKSGIGYRSSASREVGRQKGMGQEYRSASADVDSIFERAYANHGAVYSLEEWQALLNEYKEEELRANGYYFAGGVGFAPTAENFKNLPSEYAHKHLSKALSFMQRLSDKGAEMRKEDKKRLENEKLAQKNRDLANDFYGTYSLSGYDPAAGLFDNSRKRR